MVDEIRLLSSQRAYEFQPDHLRLTLLTVESARTLIQRSFGLQVAAIGTPAPVFGPVPNTLPPGLVFNFGAVAYPEGAVTPIRLLHFEAQRVVIDVAGPSSALDAVFARLRELLADLHAPDGTPAIGEPVRAVDRSEVTARCAFSPDALLPSPLRTLFTRLARLTEGKAEQILVPTVAVEAHLAGQEYANVIPPRPAAFQLALRSDYRPNARMYYSVAPLDSEAHLAYLAEFEAALA